MYGDPYVPLTPPERARKPKQPIIGYGAQYGIPYDGADEEVATGNLSLAERNALLDQVSADSPSFVSQIGDTVDYLGRNVREGLTGKPSASGVDILDQVGLLPSKTGPMSFARPFLGFGAEVALDPLTYVGVGPLGSVSKAGKAARASGFLDDAARAASRNLIRSGTKADDLGWLGQRAAKDFSSEFGLGLDNLIDEQLAARPLTGWRSARRNTTLNELLERQRDWGDDAYKTARQSLDDYFAKNGGSLDSLGGNTLANDINLPLGMGFNVPGGGMVSSGLDYLGARARWSPVGRGAAAAFNTDAGGAIGVGDQITNLTRARVDRLADSRGRGMAEKIVSTLPKFDDPAQDIRIGQGIRNYLEKNAPVLTDDALKAHDEVAEAVAKFRAGKATADQKKIGQFVTDWETLSADYLKRSQKAGIGSAALADRFGHGYFPRVLDDITFDASARSASGGQKFSVMTGDQIARGKSFHVPGSTSTLQELSLDQNVAGAGRLMATDDESAKYILARMREKEALLDKAGALPVDQKKLGKLQAALIDTQTQLQTATGAQQKFLQAQLKSIQAKIANPPKVKYTIGQAKDLARKLQKVNPEALDKNIPIFGQHPAESIERYIMGRERAMGRAGLIAKTLAAGAVPGKPGGLTDGQWTSIPKALQSLNLKTVDGVGGNGLIGAQDNVLRSILRNGTPEQKRQILNNITNPDAISAAVLRELASDASVDQRLVRRLTKMNDVFNKPEFQSQVLKTLDAITSLWKGSILSWPARFTRDWFSGIFSNTVEAESLGSLSAGYASTKYLLQGQTDRLMPMLNKMQRYASFTNPEDKLRAYLNDLAQAGISKGRQLHDVGLDHHARRTSSGVRSKYLGTNHAPETTLGYQAGDLLAGRHVAGDAVSLRNLPEAELLNVGNWSRSIAGAPRSALDAVAGRRPDDLTNPVLRWSSKIGDTTDKINRIALFNSLLIDGVSPVEAAKRVVRSHVDYSDLTNFEKSFMRRMVPFYSYSSRIGSWATQNIISKPGGKFSQLGLRLPRNIQEEGAEGEYIPTRISSKYGVPLDALRQIPVFGDAVNALAPQMPGQTSWISDFDLAGIDQLALLKVKTDQDGMPSLSETAKATLTNVAKDTHPLLKATYEATTGTDSYTGIDKNWSRSTLPVVASRLGLVDPVTGYKTANRLGYIDAALQFGLPFYSRSAQLARRLTDPRIEDGRAAGLQALFNATTGTKIENIDDQEKTRDALSKIADIVGDDPAVRSFESVYIPKELLPGVDLRTQQMYQLDRQLRKERRKAQQLRPDVYNPMNY